MAAARLGAEHQLSLKCLETSLLKFDQPPFILGEKSSTGICAFPKKQLIEHQIGLVFGSFKAHGRRGMGFSSHYIFLPSFPDNWCSGLSSFIYHQRASSRIEKKMVCFSIIFQLFRLSGENSGSRPKTVVTSKSSSIIGLVTGPVAPKRITLNTGSVING